MKETLPNSTIENVTYNNFIVLFVVAAYLFLEFFPNIGLFDNSSSQYFYMALVNFFAAAYIYFNPEIVISNPIQILQKSKPFLCYLGFLLLSTLSILVARNFSISIFSFTKLLIGFGMFLTLFMLLSQRLKLIYQIIFLVALVTFFQTFFSLIEFSGLHDPKKIGFLLANLKGTTGNINIFAASMNAKIAMLLIGFIHFKDARKWFVLIVIFCATAVIFLVSARAAFVALGLELLTFTFFYLKIYKIKKATILHLTAILVFVLFAFAFSKNVFEKASLSKTGRYASISNRLQDINDGNDVSASKRLFFWKNSIKMIAENPILGVGIGNYMLESIKYEREFQNDAIVSSHSHNDFLETATESGVLSTLFYISVFLLLVFMNLKNLFSNSDNQTKLVALLALLLIFGYGIDAFFNFPLYRPIMQLFFAICLLFTILNNSVSNGVISFSFSKIHFAALTILSVFAIFISIINVTASRFENEIKVDKKNKQTKLSANYLIANKPFFKQVGLSASAFDEYIGVYLYNEKRYDEAIKYFINAQKLIPEMGNPLFYTSKILAATGKKDSAYFYAKKAFYLRPRNEAYYLTAIDAAVYKKDTSEILKIHHIYNGYRKNAKNYFYTQNALNKCGVLNPKRLISFINEGLKYYPNDSTLLAKQKLYKEILVFFNNKNTEIAKITADSEIQKAAQVETQKWLDLKKQYLSNTAQLNAKGSYAEANQIYIKILEKEPKNKVMLQNIGVNLYLMKQFQESIPYLLKSLDSKETNDGKSEMIMAACYFNLKDKINGCKYIEIATSKNYAGALELKQKRCK